MAQRDELLHDHDHVDMVTAMLRYAAPPCSAMRPHYAGSASLPGTALPPPR